MYTLDYTLENISGADEEAIKISREYWLDLAKPLFGLGKLEDLITKIAGIKGESHFNLDKRALVVMCADNGVVCEGVTQTGSEMTAIVTGNFLRGQTGACIMAKYAKVDLLPYDVGVMTDVEGVTDKETKIAYGTKNMAVEPAMTRAEAVKAIELGINTVADLKARGYSIIATGEMGIGNTTTSSAIASVLLDKRVEEMTGRGAGLSSEGLCKKILTIKKAIEVNKPDKNDPIDVLSKVGGLDIAALTGVFLGGALLGVPIIIDGFISAVSALVAKSLCTRADYAFIPSHLSMEKATTEVFKALKLEPVICADMHLGEGTGALALIPMLDMALAVYKNLHTFHNWNGGEGYKILK